MPSNLPGKWQNSRFAKIPEACHSSFREPVAHLSLHPLSPTTLLSFYTTHPCLRSCVRVCVCVYVCIREYTRGGNHFRNTQSDLEKPGGEERRMEYALSYAKLGGFQQGTWRD